MGRGSSTQKMRQRWSWRKHKARLKRASEAKSNRFAVEIPAKKTGSAAGKQEPERKKLMTLDEYDGLSRATYEDGECANCGHYPNEPVYEALARGGDVLVVTCSACKCKMRPHPAQVRRSSCR